MASLVVLLFVTDFYRFARFLRTSNIQYAFRPEVLNLRVITLKWVI